MYTDWKSQTQRTYKPAFHQSSCCEHQPAMRIRVLNATRVGQMSNKLPTHKAPWILALSQQQTLSRKIPPCYEASNREIRRSSRAGRVTDHRVSNLSLLLRHSRLPNFCPVQR